MTLDEELVDPDAKLILSDFTQSTPQGLVVYLLNASNRVFPHGSIQEHVLHKHTRSRL